MSLLTVVIGSIYNVTASQLVKLGVNGQDLKATLKAIHLKSTEMLHWIYTSKLKKERSKDKKAPWKHKRK